MNKLLEARHAYLALMQTYLTGKLFRDTSQAPFGASHFDSKIRESGLDWPAHAQTMIGDKRLANLRELMESVIADNIPGDFIETGVWRGGACIFMRGILFSHNIDNRSVWVADSFEGLPAGNALLYPEDADCKFHTYPQLAISLEEVQSNFKSYGFLDENTKFLKGWFKDTLPTAPIQKLAIMRLDGDMYESTMDALVSLYPKLSNQGYVIIDDYHVVAACKAAVHDYCDLHKIVPHIIEIDGVGVYWRKTEQVLNDTSMPVASASELKPEEQIAKLNQAIVDISKNAIDRLTDSLSVRDSEVSTLKQSLSDQVDSSTQALSERDGQVTSLTQSLAELAQTLAIRDSQIAAYTAQLQSIWTSISWKITKPIRILGRFIN